ncbi:hypothetical protein N4839_14465, partial [Enterococcus faecalis]|nr:hypothetical protein [Enterococcus faecalis]
KEYPELLKYIADLGDIFAPPESVIEIIKTGLDDVRTKFGEARRSVLLVAEGVSLEDEDLIEEEEDVITLTTNGYIKLMPHSEF